MQQGPSRPPFNTHILSIVMLFKSAERPIAILLQLHFEIAQWSPLQPTFA